MRSAILSVLLVFLASTVAFATGKWSIETHHGCRVWDDIPFRGSVSNEYQLWWSGTCTDGYASGEGYLQWSIPDKNDPKNVLPLVRAQYDGTIVKGKLQGKGKLSASDSYRYDGDFVDGQQEGMGTESWPFGDSFTGRYANGYRNGWGAYHFSNGDAKSGEFKDDKLQDGFQTYDWAGSKDHYEGNMVKGEPSGPGFLLDKTGKHEGNWVDGVLRIGTDTYSVHPVKRDEKPSRPPI